MFNCCLLPSHTLIQLLFSPHLTPGMTLLKWRTNQRPALSFGVAGVGRKLRPVSTPKQTRSKSPSSLMTTLLQSRDSNSTSRCWWDTHSWQWIMSWFLEHRFKYFSHFWFSLISTAMLLSLSTWKCSIQTTGRLIQQMEQDREGGSSNTLGKMPESISKVFFFLTRPLDGRVMQRWEKEGRREDVSVYF